MYDPPKVVLCDTRQREKREERQEGGRDRGRKRGRAGKKNHFPGHCLILWTIKSDKEMR